MKTLEQLMASNTPEQWLTAGGTSLLLFVFLLVLKRFLVHRLTKVAQRTSTEIDDLVLDLLRRTRTLLLLLFSLYAGMQVLSTPENVQRFAGVFTTIVLLLQGGIWGNALVRFLVRRATRQRLIDDAASATTVSAMGFLGRLVLWAVVALLALDNMGFDITALVAGLGVAGIAVGLAVQNILGDLFASLSIVLDKPFVIGDFIVVDNLPGTVERIGIKTTRVRSLSGEQLVFSNADLLKSRIRNYRRMTERRVVFSVGVTYETGEEKLGTIPGILRGIVEAQGNVRFDRAHFQSFGDSALVFEVVYYILTPDYSRYMDIQQEINFAIHRRFTAEGISFAYPTRTLWLRNAGTQAS
jgi:small-conductance mechanosensitive channel